MSFQLPALPYAFDALEPHIDAQTMQIHYQKHHNAYVTNLNKAIEGTPMQNKSLEALLREESDKAPIRNNAGGHYNHTFFWESLLPGGGSQPKDELSDALHTVFGSYENFTTQFTQAALTRFGSGWAWLCAKGNELKICSTPNQDNPLMPSLCQCKDCDCACKNACCDAGFMPILGLDVWEHAYYLKYQNRRPEYIQAFFHIVNWEVIARRFREV